MNSARVMTLETLMEGVPYLSWRGKRDLHVTGIAYDTRHIKTGEIFCSWPGTQRDGAEYASDAIQAGASALVLEKDLLSQTSCPIIKVESARRALSRIAANWFGRPAMRIPVIGITGTNGKSSTAILLNHLLEAGGQPCGLMGTLFYRTGRVEYPAERTTPEALEVQQLLAEMADAGCSHAVMEVSSHGLDQGRVEGIAFRGALFTNLTHDHLDYHGTMENYFLAKARLFRQIEPDGFAILPLDDSNGKRLREWVPGSSKVVTFGLNETADSSAGDVRTFRSGSSFVWKFQDTKREVVIPWVGDFNLRNALVAMTAAVCCGMDADWVAELVERAPSVPGRMQRVGADERFTLLVDYAHTDDALGNVLRSLQPLKEKRIITIIGCGGNRDKTKRPVMARVACEMSDQVIFTADNPRDEKVEEIILQMEAGVTGWSNYRSIPDRREAIITAVREACEGDIILVAGKGHESYQEIAGIRHPFSDVEVVEQCLSRRTE
ncbi:MAG: UDP-N-acetylmuramoyl-L-alanyl-D-glutamate--2,6-diaminopimelate ligase [Candidatus Methylacidiphilales bacterium]